MRILGVDPGTARVGWAVITVDGPKVKLLSCGLITTSKDAPLPDRLQVIYAELTKILTRAQSDCMSVEDLYFSANAKTAIAVGQARGVVLLAAAKRNVPVASYPPLTVKRTVAGSGSADKTQVQRMVMRTLHLKTVPKPDDVTDAIAIALTHAFSYKMKAKRI